MSLATRLVSLAQAIGGDIKTLTTNQGTLSGLTTTKKSNLVAAINEINAALGSAGAQINDAATNGDTTVTWSADKIYDAIEAAKVAVTNSLTNGAGAALNTFKELQDALGNDPTFAATMATSLSQRVRFDSAQTLNTAEKLQACTNIGIGDPESDLVATYNTAKA